MKPDPSDLELIPFAALDRADQERVWKMRTHPDIARWMATGDDIPLEAHLAFMARQGQDTLNLNYLARDADGVAGVVSIHRIDRAVGVGHLGIYRSPWRSERGLGSRLLAAICRRAFEEEALEVFRLEVAEGNEPALALYRRFGFRPSAVEVRAGQIAMALTRSQWAGAFR